MAKRTKPGDVVEIKAENGYVYVQCLGKHPVLGDAVLVSPRKFSERPVLGADVFADGYVVFYPVSYFVPRGQAAVVGHLHPDRPVPKRVRRRGVALPGEPEPWVIDDGERAIVKASLGDEERKLPEGSIWSYEMLPYRIEEGWRPELEGAETRVSGKVTAPPPDGGTLTPLRHYLYANTQAVGATLATLLKARGFTVEQRPGAEEGKWLVLARHDVVLSEKLVAQTRSQLEGLAKRFGAEYDGWEAEVG